MQEFLDKRDSAGKESKTAVAEQCWQLLVSRIVPLCFSYC